MDVLSEEGVTSSFPSSSATPQWKYDVFLSFRGEDTRKNFTDHLYDALKRKEINTFRDDEGLEKGKLISELFKVIEESRFAVIVFSKNYADSTWCLDELAKIVECMDKTGITVLPIFYGVDPSVVKKQTGTFAKAFVEREICSMEKEQTWRAALTKVGNLNGWPLEDRHESKVIHQIVEEIFLKLHDKTKGDPLPTTKLVGEQFQINLDKIWESLMKVDVLSIGIQGMGGVGKTALLKHIHNQLLENSFNVCWVTVSQDCSIKELQTKIFNAINPKFSSEDEVNKRAAQLVQALRRIENFVIILDDVWKYIPLEEVGIHVGVNGCKLILTTRFFNVWRMMNCSIDFKVVPLNKEEAWKLFMEKFGHGIELPLEVSNIARSIAKECAGLPLGIITVARSMSGMGIDIREWRNALEELKNSESRLDDMEAKVFDALKFSYSRLKDPKLQECFLNCSLYPEDYKITRHKLIEHLIDERIIKRQRSRQVELDMGHSMLNKLESAFLLEGIKNDVMDECVRMHDLLRDMAIQIGRSSHNRFMVKAGKGLKDLPDEEEWKDDLVKVSLMCNNFSKIPSNASPRCPKLLTLMLNDNMYLPIGNSFFAHMSGLKVLNLSNNDNIEDLQDSISNLENLTALLLEGCERLKHVPSLAKLTSLRRLDLNLTGIEEIPQGLEMLVNLRFLDLNYCSDLKIFPTGILPKLSHLQYLVFDSYSKTLKVKGEEVASLKKLETFRGQLYDIHDFNRYIISLEEEGRPNDYLLQVGAVDISVYFGDLFPLEEKTVVLRNCSISKSRGGEDSLVLPKDLQGLELIDISDLRSLCDIPSFNDLAKLKLLIVRYCHEIDHIFCSDCILPLQSVECLRLEWLDNLRVLTSKERVASSLVPPNTYSRLKEFEMYSCGNIKKLFTPELLLHLQNLEKIEVRYCSELVEIIGALSNEVEEEDERNKEEGMDTTIFSLPKLRFLELYNLPKLKSICASSEVMVCDSIQEIEISYCPNLKRFPLFLPLLNGQLCAPPSLEKIKADKELWESLDPNYKTVLQPLLDLR